MPHRFTPRFLLALTLPVAVLLTSCGGSSGTPISATTPGSTTTPVVFTAASQSTSLNETGGSLSLTSADGTRFQLDLPAGALAGATTLTLATQTPAAGQQFNLLLQPAGLVLNSGTTGTLTIALPAGASLPTTGALAYDGVLVPFTRLADGRIQVSLSAFAAATSSASAFGATLSAAATKRAAAVSATACAPTLASDAGLVALAALDPALYGQCMTSAVQELANTVVFPNAMRVALSVTAYLQNIGSSNADRAMSDSGALTCAAYGGALDRARNTTATTTVTLHNLIDPVMYWESVVQLLGATCSRIGLTDYQTVVHIKIGESLVYYGSVAPTITDVAAAPYVQAKADAVHSVRAQNEVLALNPPAGVRSTLHTEVTQRAQPAVVTALLKAPWQRTRSTGNYDEFISLKTSVGDVVSLKDAAQYAGTELKVEALNNQNQVQSTITALGGVAAGQNQVTATITATADGVIRLTGPIKALSCPAGFASSEELVLRFAGMEVARLSVAPYLSAALALNVADLRAVAGLAGDDTRAQALTFERTGFACAGFWGAAPMPLITVTVEFPAATPPPPPRYLTMSVLGKIHADGTDDVSFANVSFVSGAGSCCNSSNPNVGWMGGDSPAGGVSATGFSYGAGRDVADLVITAELTDRPPRTRQAQGTLWLAFSATVAGTLTIELNNAWPTSPTWALQCLPQDSGWNTDPVAMSPGVVVKLRLPLTRSMLDNCNGTPRSDAPEFLTGSGRLATFRFRPNSAP